MQRLLALFLVLTFAGCSALNPKEADVFQRGLDAFENEHWSLALDSASLVLETKPNFVPAKLLQGKALFHLEKFDAALEAMSEVTLAVDAGDDPKTAFTARFYSGRCHVEKGRLQLPDAELAATELSSEKRRASRDFFIAANLAFLNALKIEPRDYDAMLWRGYSILRLENFRKAVDTFKVCDRIAPGRWEHRFFSGLALEGLYKANAQSLDGYIEIVRSGPKEEFKPVYEHLTAIHDSVAPEVADTFFGILRDFSAKFPEASQRVNSFLTRVRAQREHDEAVVKLQRVGEKAQELATQGNLRQAIHLVEAFLGEFKETPELETRLAAAKEEWSLLFEASGEGLAAATSRTDLETVLSCYEWARRLTNKVDRLVVLQQKINAAQVAVSRQRTSEKIVETYDLLKEEKYEEILQKLADTSLDGLSEGDLDLFHYMQGTAHYHLGQWKTAADSFRKVNRRDFDQLETLHGLALIQSGQKSAGVALLVNLPAESETEEGNRLLGQHFFEQKDFAQAAERFERLERPHPEDSAAHFEARRQLGLAYYNDGAFQEAAREFEAACKLLETQLQQRAPEAYLYLGNAYFRIKELERAHKVYQDLSNSGLTPVERKKCRDLFLHRGQIHLEERRQDLAFKDFSEFVTLEGELPENLRETFGHLVATYANFMPLESVEYWNYVSTTMDYNYTLSVSKKETGAYRVLRREGGNRVSEETWWRQGIYLTKEIGEGIFKIPLNLDPSETNMPFVEYTSRGKDCTSEIVAIDQTVEIPGRRTFEHCLKVRTRQKVQGAAGALNTTTHVLYLAPDVGEVRQEIYGDDVKVSEIVLSQHARRDALLGN